MTNYTLNLNEIRTLKAKLGKKLYALRAKLNASATVEIMADEDFHDYINKDIFQISQEIELLLDDLHTLQKIVARENGKFETYQINNKQITANLASLIAYNKELREDLDTYNRLATMNPRKRSHSGYGDTPLITVTTFDIEKAGKYAKELEIRCDEISALIDAKDLNTRIEFTLKGEY